MDLPGTGKPGGDMGSARGDEYYLPIKRTDFGTRVNTYKKTFHIVSECFVSVIIPSSPTGKLYVTSELLEIPWHLPCMYMTPSEFKLLSPGAYCKNVKCQVIFRGCTVKFETNASSTQVATLNTIQNLKAAVGLNKSGWGGQFFYSALNPSDPMIPQGVIPASYSTAGGRTRSLEEELYGKADKLGVPGAYNTGNFLIGRNYWCDVSSNSSGSTLGWPTARSQMYKEWDAKTMIDKVIVSETYSPKMGCLTIPLAYYRETVPESTTGLVMSVGQNLTNGRKATYLDASGKHTVTESNQDLTTTMPTFTILSSIEKSQELKQGPWGTSIPQIQPSINVGVQGMPQLGSINYINGSYQNMVQGSSYYDVSFEMEVVEHNPTHFNYSSTANVPAGDEIFVQGTPSYNVSNATYAGLLPN